MSLFRIVSNTLTARDSTFDSIYIIINTQDEQERDNLTERWRDHKLEELNFIGIVGALLAGCLTSTGDWPNILSNGREQPWTVRACWFSGIVCALFSVLSVAQQAMALHRLSGHRDGLQRIRNCMIRGARDGDGNLQPRKLRIYAWFVGPVLLVASVLFMVVGMAIMLWVGTGIGPDSEPNASWWQSTSKLAVTWTLVLVISLLAFGAAQLTLVESSSTPDEQYNSNAQQPKSSA